MRFTLAAFFALSTATAALAQTPTPVEYRLTVTAQDIQTLGAALGELPYKSSAQLVQKLNAQIAQQDAERNKPADPKPEPESK